MTAPSPLRALSNLIVSGVDVIETAYANHQATFPSLDDPFRPPPFDDRELVESANLVIAAAAQLIACLRPPVDTILFTAQSYLISGALGVVSNASIAEALTEAGPEGLHVSKIAAKCDTDTSKIVIDAFSGRILRLLATLHIFREVSPDVFANNRISSLLDTGKSVEAIKANPEDRYNDTRGLTALIDHVVDEGFKSTSAIVEHFADPKTVRSHAPLDAPFNRGLRTSAHIFEWYEQPENALRFKRFGIAMTAPTITLDTAFKSLDWKALPEGSVIVDVGGGVGTASLAFSKAFPHLRFVIQERKAVIEDGKKHWEIEYPEALVEQRVHFQEHDFFTPQPIQDASVFFLRFITHDWPQKEAKQILKHLSEAARPSTKLILVDNVVPYACPTDQLFPDIKGSNMPKAPYPLLANLGLAGEFPTRMDIHMLTFFNAQERTVGEFVDLADGTGWNLESISRGVNSSLSALVFKKVAL